MKKWIFVLAALLAFNPLHARFVRPQESTESMKKIGIAVIYGPMLKNMVKNIAALYRDTVSDPDYDPENDSRFRGMDPEKTLSDYGGRLAGRAALVLSNITMDTADPSHYLKEGIVILDREKWNKKPREIMKELGLDGLLIITLETDNFYRTMQVWNGTLSWYESGLKFRLDLMNTGGDFCWSSADVPVLSFEMPDVKTRAVYKKKPAVWLAEMMELPTDAVYKPLRELLAVGKDYTVLFEVYGNAGFSGLSADLKAAGTAAAETMGLETLMESYLGWGARLTFKTGGPLVFGLSFSGSKLSSENSETYDDVGKTGVSFLYTDWSLAPVIGLDLSPDKRAPLLLTLEPSISLSTFSYSYMLVLSNSFSCTGLGFGGALRLTYSLPVVEDSIPGSFSPLFTFGLILGFRYIPVLTNSQGALYSVESPGVPALYLSDGSLVLPNSRKAEYLSGYLGLQLSIGFGI